MKMILRVTAFFAAMAAVFLSGTARGGEILNTLDSEQRAQLLEGRQVFVEREVEGKPWPRVKVYELVNATPEEVLAVFSDYEKANTYVPDVLSSRIVKRHSPQVKDVEYEVEVPFLRDERYTARNSLDRSPDGALRVSWKLLEALQTKDAEGHLVVENFEGGRAVLCYTNLVTPGSAMAGLLRGPALERMRKTVAAIVAKVELEKRERPAELAAQAEKLREILDDDEDEDEP
jgi:hypothetical protein